MAGMPHSSDRLERFARHIVLPEIGGVGQALLMQSSVAVIGLGGIGSPALQYLAGAGVGYLRLLDDDRVDATNLQRQTIYSEHSLGQPKIEMAADWIEAFDPDIKVEDSGMRIDADSAGAFINGVDLVLDGTDNFATRLAVSDACVRAGVPLLSAAVGRFQGQVGAFAGHLDDQPCYRCFVGDAFDADDCDTCAEDGMLGAMAGWAGTFAAMQAIRVLLAPQGGMGDPQFGTLHLLDGLTPALRSLNIAKDPGCRGCGLAL